MAVSTFTGPAFSGVVSPAYKKMAFDSNYLDIQNNGWAQQYLPDLYEQEVDRYGNRTVSGFLSMLSAEMPLQSDQVIWSEQGRLHLAYNGQINPVTGAVDTITSIDSVDGDPQAETHAVRKGATVVAVVNNVVFKALVTAGIETSNTALTIRPYTAVNVDDLAGIATTDNQVIKFFVYGSEFAKGCLLYTSPSPRDGLLSRMPSSA